MAVTRRPRAGSDSSSEDNGGGRGDAPRNAPRSRTRSSSGVDAETAFTANHELLALQEIGRNILAEPQPGPGVDGSTRLRLQNWTGQVHAALTTLLPGATYLREESQSLNRRSFTADKPEEMRLVVGDALNLLAAAQQWIRPDHRLDISAALEQKIYEALVKQYFRRWPWYLLFTLILAFSAALAGGSLYAGIKVDGVLNQAEAAKKTINEQTDKAIQSIADANSKINAAIQKEVDKAADEAKSASVAKLADLQTKLDAQLRQNQTDSQTKIDAAVTTATTNIGNQEKSAAQSLTDQQKMSSAALATATGSELQTLSQTLTTQSDTSTKAIAAAVKEITDRATKADSNIDKAVGGASAYAEKAKSDIDQAVGIFTGYAANAKTQIDQAVTVANGYRATLEKMVETAKTDLPNEVHNAVAALKQFDELVANYRTPLEAFIARSAGDEKLPGLWAAAIVLGWTRWLVFGALVASIIALVLQVGAFLLRRRRTPASAVT